MRAHICFLSVLYWLTFVQIRQILETLSFLLCHLKHMRSKAGERERANSGERAGGMNSELEGADKWWRELLEGVVFRTFEETSLPNFSPPCSLSCGLTSSPKFTRVWQFHFIHDPLTDYPNICSGGQVCPGSCLKHPLTPSPLASVHTEFRPN